jgi:hypothetical protein
VAWVSAVFPQLKPASPPLKIRLNRAVFVAAFYGVTFPPVTNFLFTS